MSLRCTVLTCSTNKQHGSANLPALFRFPRDPDRCMKWVENLSLHRDLQDKRPEELYRHHRLCAKHFDPSLIETTVSDVMTLKVEAMPTVFEPSTLPGSRSRQCKKRKIYKTEDNVKNVKKKDSTDKTNANNKDTSPMTPEQEQKELLRSQFEALLVLSKQNIPLNVHTDEAQESHTTSNVQALLEYKMNAGDEVLKKKFQPGEELCPPAQLGQMIQVCEDYIRQELMQEVREARFFSLITGNVVEIEERCHLPVFLRFVDQSPCLREELAGLLPFDIDDESLAEQLLSEVTEKWGLNMEQCRGQAHLSSGVHASKMKAIASKITEKYPKALHCTLSTIALNTSLANSMPLSGVQIVMSTFKKIEAFFKDSPLLQLELEHAISIFYQGKKEKAIELKEACHTNWTLRHDAFEVGVDIIESLLLCVDSVHDNEDLRWSDEITHDALEISKALADFEFVIALVVLKNTLSFTRAFGNNLQGPATDAYFAVDNLTAVMHSLNEVSDNVDVYHEFWFEEAVNLAAAMEIPVKVPRLFLRKHRSESESGAEEVQPENYYKQHLSVPAVSHVLEQMKGLFTDDHVKAMRCLVLVPGVMEGLKFETSGEENLDVYKSDLTNAETLSAELTCWWVKWKHRVKKDSLPASVYEAVMFGDAKFFPNVLAFLKVLASLPVLVPESAVDATRKRFQQYVENTPDNCRSKSLTFINMHYDAPHNLDLMVDTYTAKYSKKD